MLRVVFCLGGHSSKREPEAAAMTSLAINADAPTLHLHVSLRGRQAYPSAALRISCSGFIGSVEAGKDMRQVLGF